MRCIFNIYSLIHTKVAQLSIFLVYELGTKRYPGGFIKYRTCCSI